MDARMKLYPGAGKKRREGFIHADIRPGVCEHTINIESIPWALDGTMIPTGGVEHLFLSHTLEHASWRNLAAILDECARVVRIGGVLEIVVPNLRGILEWALASQALDLDHLSRLFGGQDYRENTHRAGFDERLLRRMVWEAGFIDISVTGGDGGRALRLSAKRRNFPCE